MNRLSLGLVTLITLYFPIVGIGWATLVVLNPIKTVSWVLGVLFP